MNSEIWVVTAHYGKGHVNGIKSFSEYGAAIKYLERITPLSVSLKKVELVSNEDYQSKLRDGLCERV